jgi:hypothetical protein
MMLRALYDEDRKFVWDQQNNSVVYRLDPDRPCWETEVLRKVDIEHLNSAFGTDIETAAKKTRSIDSIQIDDGVADRLRELGYL